MPSRNVLKLDVADSYYHVYARGNSRSEIFLDADDYAVFLNLFKRYLSVSTQKNKLGVPYPYLYGKLEFLCYCLMPLEARPLTHADDFDWLPAVNITPW